MGRHVNDTDRPASDYPSDLDEYLTLPNQLRVRVRPLVRGEDGTINELYAHLGPLTRYRRFFSLMPTLPESVVRLLTAVDYRRSLALVAQHERGPGRDIIALASFGAIDESSAEVALVVRDEWQRQRLGLMLAMRVLEAAEARGFHRFVAQFRSDNVAIRRLLKKVGDVVSWKVSSGTSEVVFVRRGVIGFPALTPRSV